ncbi:MAG: type II secretion system F family protein [Thermoplasmata archaeon]
MADAGFAARVFTIPMLILFALAAISLFIWLPYYKRISRMRAIEADYPGFLKSMARHIKAGNSIESALIEASRTRSGYMKEVVDKIIADVRLGRTLDEALARSRVEVESDIISKVLSIIRIALKQNAPVSDVLEEVADELWTVNLLKIDRQSKTKAIGRLILYGGIVFSPALIAFVIVWLTGYSMLGVDIDEIVLPMEVFCITLGPMSSMMFGITCDKEDRGVILMPLHTFIAYCSFALMLGLSETIKGKPFI